MANRSRNRTVPIAAAAAAVALLLAAGGAVWGVRLMHSRRAAAAPVRPPEVSLQGLEPEAVSLITSARDAVTADPTSGAAWGRLGQVLVANDFFEPGARSLAEAGRLEPYDPRWPYLRGRALQEQKPQEALADLRRAADMVGGTNTAPKLTLAEFLIRRAAGDDLKDAEKLVADALENNPDDPRGLLDRGRIEHARGDEESALKDLRRSSRRAPDVRATRVLMANVQERLGKHAEAEVSLRQAATLTDDVIWPDKWVAELAPLRVGERADLEYGRALLAENRTDELVAFAQKTAAKYPKNPMAWEQLGIAFGQIRRFPEAEAAFRNAVERDPESLRCLLRLILTLGMEKKYDDVERLSRQAIRMRPDAGEPHYYYGAAFARRGQWEPAIREFREAVRLRPDIARFHDGLGEALYKSGNPEAARAEFQESLKLEPKDPVATLYLGHTTEGPQ